jgi:hypothetical protein
MTTPRRDDAALWWEAGVQEMGMGTSRSSRRGGGMSMWGDDGGGGGGFGMGAVRTELEMQQYIAELEEVERRRMMREATAAVVPAMLDHEERSLQAFDPCSNSMWSTDGLPCRCRSLRLQTPCGGAFGRRVGNRTLQPCNCVVVFMEQNDMVNPWSDMEKLIFMDKFMQVRSVSPRREVCIRAIHSCVCACEQFPKDFGLIASFLLNKTPQDCATFYYNTKYAVQYKRKLRQQSIALRRRNPRNGWALAVQAAQSVGYVRRRRFADSWRVALTLAHRVS